MQCGLFYACTMLLPRRGVWQSTVVMLFRIGISVSGSCYNFYRSQIARLFLFIVSLCGDGIEPEGRLRVAWGTCYSASDALLR